MSNDSEATSGTTADSRQGFLDRFAKSLVRKALTRLQEGRVTLVDAEEKHSFGQSGSERDLEVTVIVQDVHFYRLIAFKGTLGAAEAFIKGYWTCNDLTSLVRIFARRIEAADEMESGLARIGQPLAKLYYWFQSNTKKGSRENIYAHYDLGNDFFNLFLDPTMTYSCAVFEPSGSTLEEAQIEKLDRICRKLALEPADHVLEIGSGWGSFAIHAATNYGCRVTTTTISSAQRELAQQRIMDAGVADRVTLLLEDYRELKGQYDKLVSIEMIEAVGEKYLDTFFRKCSELLNPEGMMLLQAITIADQRYEQYRKSVDFIQHFVFPGSFLPSIQAMIQSLARVSDLRLFHLEDITAHYAQTLRLWRERFFDNLEGVRSMGFPDDFIRMWDFYLCSCEGGFAERYIGDVQMTFTKPRCRRAPIVPRIPGREA